MKHSTRRRWDVVWLGAAAVTVGAAAAVAALLGDTERIGNYWLHASIGADGTAQVVEVIDYDFGPASRHGILRNIPGIDPDAQITVSSPTAPDQVERSLGLRDVRLRVGDPFTTISNRHRYRISYPIDTLVEGDRLAWNAIGLDWTVGIDDADIHVTADREFSDLACHRGSSGAHGGCSVSQIAPGHLLVEVGGLDAEQAVTVEGTLGAALPAAPATPISPSGPAVDPGTGWFAPAVAALGAALLAGGVTSRRIRGLGKEQVWSGGAADAAFGPPLGEVAGVERVDHEQLAEMATTEFASPRGMSATAGGIIHAEKVESEHQIAWLIECAIRDEIVLEEDGDDFVLVRGPAEPHAAVADRLDDIFSGGVDRVELGEYDSSFASAWTRLGAELDEWRAASGLWDPMGHRRRTKARWLGFLAGLVGLGLVVLGAIIANRAGTPWLVLCVVGALAAGAGMAAIIRSWELPIRTPQGSGHWIQVESFRRFIEASEARHAEAAAQMGLLRQYTAWAVALGELDHWKDAVEDAINVPGSAASQAIADYHFVTIAPSLSSATAQTFTAPSSSGGSGGGGAGGGGGGGGGGSW